MQGWKTWTGVIGLVITQIAVIFLDVDMDAAESTATTLINAIQACFAAITAVGLGHKLDKIKGL